MKRVALLLSFAVLSACPLKPTPVALCALADKPPDLDGRTVSTEGFLLVSQHGSAIMDPTCGRGVVVTWYDTSQLKSLTEIVARYRREGVMLVKLRVIGTMEAKQYKEGPGGHLTLTQAQVLAAESLPEADKDRFITWLDIPSSAPFRRSQ